MKTPYEANFGYNPDICSLNYRLVNTQISEPGLNDSRGLAGACAKGFSEHLHRPEAAPALAFADVYLQCRNRCMAHGNPSRGQDTMLCDCHKLGKRFTPGGCDSHGGHPGSVRRATFRIVSLWSMMY